VQVFSSESRLGVDEARTVIGGWLGLESASEKAAAHG